MHTRLHIFNTIISGRMKMFKFISRIIETFTRIDSALLFQYSNPQSKT